MNRSDFRAWLERHQSRTFKSLNHRECPLAVWLHEPVVPSLMHADWAKDFGARVDRAGHGATITGARALQILDEMP